MFAPDRRTLTRIEPVIRRVLVVDHNQHAARLITDIMKGLGSREVIVEHDEKRALRTAGELSPGIVFTEYQGDKLDGLAFTRSLRRSMLECRQAPVIMVTAEATASSIKGARDVGVHEFLRKPFTSADLFKRVENVALKPRDWVEGVSYVGPDRRRFNSGEYAGPQKRRTDKPSSQAEVDVATKDQAMRILAAALDQFDSDPMQARRALKQQVDTLRALAMRKSDVPLAVAAAGLDAALAGAPTRDAVVKPVQALLALADPKDMAKAG